MARVRRRDADILFRAGGPRVLNYAVWKAASSSELARENLMEARVRALYRDSEFWATLVRQNNPALFVDRLYSAVSNLTRQTTLNHNWIRDARTAQAVVEIIVDDIVGGLFARVMDRLDEKLERALGSD